MTNAERARQLEGLFEFIREGCPPHFDFKKGKEEFYIEIERILDTKDLEHQKKIEQLEAEVKRLHELLQGEEYGNAVIRVDLESLISETEEEVETVKEIVQYPISCEIVVRRLDKLLTKLRQRKSQ